MLSINSCPDCGNKLSEGRNRCTCGWFNISVPKEEHSYRCQYRENGVRCNNEGTNSPYTRGNHWYCRKHNK